MVLQVTELPPRLPSCLLETLHTVEGSLLVLSFLTCLKLASTSGKALLAPVAKQRQNQPLEALISFCLPCPAGSTGRNWTKQPKINF